MYPILVTGSPRSGTSWIGKMISLSSQIGYLPETYNVLIMENLPGEPLPNQFGIQADLESNLVEEDFTKIIQFRYSFRDLITRNKSFPNLINSIITHFRFRSFRRKNLVPLLKDPYMIFSTDWLFEKFGVRPLILIRHPGPILDSYKRLNWELDFDHIYDHLKNEELKQVIASSGILSNKLPSRPIQIAVLWNLIHKQIAIYQERYPEWLFLRYEDIFLNIESNFSDIFQYLGLDLNDDILSNIYHYTSRGYFAGESRRSTARIERKDLLNGWKHRLTDEELNDLQSNIDPEIYHRYYTDENWTRDIKF